MCRHNSSGSKVTRSHQNSLTRNYVKHEGQNLCAILYNAQIRYIYDLVLSQYSIILTISCRREQIYRNSTQLEYIQRFDTNVKYIEGRESQRFRVFSTRLSYFLGVLTHKTKYISLSTCARKTLFFSQTRQQRCCNIVTERERE